jgi:hyperosmotically inducible protein
VWHASCDEGDGVLLRHSTFEAMKTILHNPSSLWMLMTLVSTSTFALATPEMGPSGDAEISEYIAMDVASDAKLDGSQISVRIDHGIAILTGTVLTIDQAERAGERALAAPATRAVVNQLRVKPAGTSDSSITSAVKSSLLKNRAIDAKRVTVKTAEGKVSLGGEVGTWDEQELAREIASTVPGVVMIDNRTEVVFDSVRTDAQIQDQLRQLIANDPLYENVSLSVSVKEGVVRLKGKVGSKEEYDRLVRRTSVTGVFEVNANNLNVDSDLKMEAMGDKNFSPEQMMAAMGDALKADSRVDASTITYGISEGVATLTGQVGSSEAKVAAESTARGVPGVLAVHNQLRVQENRPEMVANVPVKIP